MPIKMLTGIAGVDFSVSPGKDTDRFSADEEQALIDAGHAIRVSSPPAGSTAKPKVEKAVKPKARETR